MPTSKPSASTVCNKLLLMMDILKANMTKRLQELKEEEIIPLADFMTNISTTAISNEESLQKVKSNLNAATQNISKLETRLTMQKKSIPLNKKISTDASQTLQAMTKTT
eukprot:13924601-Ditylum_brightwellii.AAC.1